MTLATDLKTVRALLAVRGRVRGGAFTTDGRICLATAMNTAIGDIKVQGRDCALKRLFAMRRALVKQMPQWIQATYKDDSGVAIVAFNDTTKDDRDVFDVIDKALAELEALA